MTNGRGTTSQVVPFGRTGKRAWLRDLPHFQSDFRAYHVRFATADRHVLSPVARSITMHHILIDHGRRMLVHAACVMPDHAHLVCTPAADERGHCWSLSKIMQGIKGSSSRAINERFGTAGQVWQHESFDHEIRKDEYLRSKCDYVINNPVRAGIVSRVDDYEWIWREWIEGRSAG